MLDDWYLDMIHEAMESLPADVTPDGNAVAKATLTGCAFIAQALRGGMGPPAAFFDLV